jgi:hypothetical protein
MSAATSKRSSRPITWTATSIATFTAQLRPVCERIPRVGGWCSQTIVGEDHVMWNVLRQSGQRMRQTTSVHVMTSARTRSRVVGGFATNLGATLRPQRSRS